MTTAELNEFEAHIKALAPFTLWKEHVLDVCDTAFLVRAWFRSYGIAYSAADIVAMTAMILAREKPS